MDDPRINVLGVGISALTLESAWTRILAKLRKGEQGYITVTGVHGVSECQSDAELRRIHNESLLSTPDGMPLVWMGRLQGVGAEQLSRVYGPDLMLDIIDRGQAEGLRHYLFGGRDGVVELLQEKLLERFPDAQIVGTYTPPFKPLDDREEKHLVEQLYRLRPHCLWVGLGNPKQERFMARLLSRYGNGSNKPGGENLLLPKPLMMFGVGAAFDFHAGADPSGSALDATNRFGMVVPPTARATATLETLSEKQPALHRSSVATTLGCSKVSSARTTS